MNFGFQNAEIAPAAMATSMDVNAVPRWECVPASSAPLLPARHPHHLLWHNLQEDGCQLLLVLYQVEAAVAAEDLQCVVSSVVPADADSGTVAVFLMATS
jgi:hypothetical protein